MNLLLPSPRDHRASSEVLCAAAFGCSRATVIRTQNT